MRAIVQDQYGTSDQLALTEVPDPTPGPGEVLIRVAAAGVDRGTWHVMTGLPLLARLGLGLRRPKDRIPGRDVAGTIIALGDGVIGVAAREGTPVRITHMTSAYLYSQAVRSGLQDRGLVPPDSTEIPYPGLPEPHSQLAVPLRSGGRVLTVDEATLSEAETRAGAAVDATGTAGLAGLLSWRRARPRGNETCAVLFTGARR